MTIMAETPQLDTETVTRHRIPAVEAVAVGHTIGDRRTLQDVNLQVHHGEVLAIAGGSGAGKTTLLRTLAGVQLPTEGYVATPRAESDSAGYVPQDDIIHLEMPLGRTLRHSAKLRLPSHSTGDELDAAVARVLDRLDLTDRADVAVESLSGGQRKRASIATELLTNPQVLLLDEPTSGLDPATGATVIRQLRHLADAGTAVVVTTHTPADLALCDRVVFLASGGRVAFVGSPGDAPAHFGVETLVDVYEQLAQATHRFVAPPAGVAAPVQELSSAGSHYGSRGSVRSAGTMRQVGALVARNTELLTRNRLTMAILLGSPTMVVAMMAILFRSGSFEATTTNSAPAVQTLFWVAFASFFFGVTYGLLQIVGEFEIFRRERHAGLSIGAYIASKLVVLMPLLVGVNGLMLLVLRRLDRLPSASWQSWAEIMTSAVLLSTAAVSLGLCASALVKNPAQATLALPMLCFPQVLFAGAAVPVANMTLAGELMSVWQAGRWGFEAFGRSLGIDALVLRDPSGGGYADAFSGSPVTGWLVMTIIAAIALTGTARILRRRTEVS
jgi:ABC-type multidrug transport system ATPase subunit